MRFTLLDRIVAITPGQRIEAVKNLSAAEEYLADHFPLFPVMPGVLMLEAMTQAGAWLIRASENFAHSIVVLKEARNVKYADFVRPGETLLVTAEIVSQTATETTLKAQGTVAGKVNVSGRLVLTRYNLADENQQHAETDERVRAKMRDFFTLLYPQADVTGNVASNGAVRTGVSSESMPATV